VVRQAKGDGKTHTVQDSIPFRNMFPDGLCRLEGGAFSKTIAFEDVNYRLASPEDQRDIFEHLCDFYNGYDPTIGVQMSLSSRYVEHGPEEDLFGIRPQGDDLDPVREDAAGILRFQYERGSNGYVKTKYVTLTIEAENLPAARARFARIETDTLNRFKVMGAAAHVLDGKERLELLHGILHPADGRRPEGGKFAFDWDWLAPSGLSVKDFIAPSSFQFGETRTFRIGEMYGAVSFLQITAPEIHDRILAEFMETEGNILVTMVGQSLGGVVAQVIASRHPEVVEGLVLSNTCSLSGNMSKAGYQDLMKIIESQRKFKKWLAFLPFPLIKRMMRWAVMKKKTDGFTAQEKAAMEELCGAMMELLTKPYEQHMIDFLCDAEHYFGMTRNDFAPWEGRVLLILSEDDTTFTPACREDLIALMPSPTVVTDLTGGHLALMVRLEQYADLVTKFILERTP